MLFVAKYCIEFRKDSKLWNAPGCYGYPAALILLSLIDSIGSYIIGGNVKNHFKILNDPTYFNLALDDEFIDVIYNHYRNTLSHNTVITPKVRLEIGHKNKPVIQRADDGKFVLNLIPLYIAVRRAVVKFLNNPDTLTNNQTILNISRK